MEEEEIDDEEVEKREEIQERMCFHIKGLFKNFMDLHGLEDIYLISSLPDERNKYDFLRLEQHITLALKSGRGVHTEQECPICRQKYAEYGGQ